MFEECISALVDGLFQGYNGTVLAYGQVISLLYIKILNGARPHIMSHFHYRHICMLQTGSGKTYTMGTSFKDGCQTGLIPQVMNALFNKIKTLNHQTEFQLHVSFIEVIHYMVVFLYLIPRYSLGHVL